MDIPAPRVVPRFAGRQKWVAAGLLCCIGAGTAWTLSLGAHPESTDAPGYAAQIEARESAADRAASRSSNRVATTPSTTRSATSSKSVTASAAPNPTPSSGTPTAAPASTEPTLPAPVAGLTQAQMNNAATIVKTGLDLEMPTEALVIAIATALQESNLYNLASEAVPESLNYPHEGTGSDYDSVGLFQQRTSTGWGTVKQIMTPTYAATAFYQALSQVVGWQSMSLTQAAQAVQVSAYPDAYAKHETRARTIVAALT